MGPTVIYDDNATPCYPLFCFPVFVFPVPDVPIIPLRERLAMRARVIRHGLSRVMACNDRGPPTGSNHSARGKGPRMPEKV